jgi:hypothetical protein
MTLLTPKANPQNVAPTARPMVLLSASQDRRGPADRQAQRPVNTLPKGKSPSKQPELNQPLPPKHLPEAAPPNTFRKGTPLGFALF